MYKLPALITPASVICRKSPKHSLCVSRCCCGCWINSTPTHLGSHEIGPGTVRWRGAAQADLPRWQMGAAQLRPVWLRHGVLPQLHHAPSADVRYVYYYYCVLWLWRKGGGSGWSSVSLLKCETCVFALILICANCLHAAGIQKHLLYTGIGALFGKITDGWRNEYLAERDAVLRHYIQLHPEDFPVPSEWWHLRNCTYVHWMINNLWLFLWCL